MTLPRIIPRAEHPISRGYIDPDALRVLYRLHRSGFKAFLVGGSVRDLMTGRTPKDFDIGTDAKPQEVRRLFRNSRVIGRRFRLVHVVFDDGKVVEVSTFRKRPTAESEAGGASAPAGDEDILIRSDNVFGTPEEDAERRDFTINGLFYDIASFAVIDYVGGVTDLERRVVRTIGDPDVRFREDPVRMMRACEFAARLNFEMDGDLRDALRENRMELRKSAAPRVTEELLDPLRRGWGSETYRIWHEAGLLEVLLPELDEEIHAHTGKAAFAPLFWRLLAESDRRVLAGEKFPDAALLGVVMLPLLFAAIRRRSGEGKRVDASRLLLVLEDVVNPLAARLTLPNHAVHLLKQGLYTMGRLAEVRPRDPAARKLVGKSYFPIAVSLLSLYAAASGRYAAPAEEWVEVVARTGHRLRKGEDEEYGAPFPEALVPSAHDVAGSDFLPPIPPVPVVDARGGRPRRRRRGPRRVGTEAVVPG